MKTIQFREAICEAMSEEMRRDESVYLMGEEVAEYNGAYKVSQGMLDEFGSKRVHKIGTANIYDNDIKNIYEETSAQKHSALAVSKSVRNLLGKSILEITVPGLHNLPQNGHKTIGRVISVLSIADVEQHTELFDRKRTGDYIIYSAKHTFTKERYTTGLSLVKIANYRGNTRVGSGGAS